MHAKTLHPTVFLTKSSKPNYTLRCGCAWVFAQRKLAAGSEKTVTENKLARQRGGKTAQTLLLCKRKFVLRCTNTSHDFSIHMGAPSQAAPPTIDAIQNQEDSGMGSTAQKCFLLNSLFSREALHSLKDSWL